MGKFYRVTSEIQCLGPTMSVLLSVGMRVRHIRRRYDYTHNKGGWFKASNDGDVVWVIGGVLRPETPFETAEELIKGDW